MSTSDAIAIWAAVFAGVAALAAIAAAIIAAKQRRDGRRSAIAAERSAIAAERSAAAAEEAVREAKNAAKIAAEGTRAWIVYQCAGTSVNLQDPSKQTFWVEVTLVNTGKIPTSRRMSRHAWRLMGQFAWPEKNDKVCTVEEKPPLPPGSPDVIRKTIEIRTADFQALQNGSLGLYVFGIEEYETLGEARRMMWCVQYQVPSKQFSYRADLSESG
jgi:hypothetical protein